MKIKHPINLHKGITFLVVLGLMFIYDNFSIGLLFPKLLFGNKINFRSNEKET
jgi:hypothetical protein